MARLQKKKTVSQKIKKKQKTVDRQAPAGAVESVAKSEPAGVAVKKKPQVKPVKAAAKPQDENIVSKSMQFLREVNLELRKVVWPTRKQTVASTVVVIVLVIIISIFLGLVDIGLSALVRTVLQ